MATVHGTFEPNGAVFCDLPECVNYCAEPIWTGEHAGQVALTLSNADYEGCNDTFYGCVNWTTGKFRVVIPDACCVYGECVECFDEGETPLYIQVKFAGVTLCSGESWPGDVNLNTCWTLKQQDWGSEYRYCRYLYSDINWTITFTYFYSFFGGATRTVVGATSSGDCNYFYTDEESPCTVKVHSERTIEQCDTHCGYDGSCTVISGNEPYWSVSTEYAVNEVIFNTISESIVSFRCILGHTSSIDDEPGIGINWETYWVRLCPEE